MTNYQKRKEKNDEYRSIAGVCRHDRNDQSRNGSQFFDMHYFLRYHASTYQLNMEAAYEQNEKHRTYPLRSCAGAYPKFSRGAGSGIAESDTVDQPHPCGRYPSAVLSVRLEHHQQHPQVLAALSEITGVIMIEEI